MPALDASGLKSVLARFRQHLREHREDLNRLNVYPIPDGDTGTNLMLTVDAVLVEAERAQSLDDVCDAMTHGSLIGARGNSGVILAQVFAALAAGFRGVAGVGAIQLRAGLNGASTAAYSAVLEPVEGTMLTVLREAAAAAAEDSADLSELARRTYEAAEASVRDTPRLLPVLRAAGVVDAGGTGLLALFAALLEEVEGREIALPPDLFRTGSPAEKPTEPAYRRYEVMCLFEGSADSVEALRIAWAGLGDSIVVVGDGGLYSAHVHTDDADAAVAAAHRTGKPGRVRVRDLWVEAGEEEFHANGPFTPLPEVVNAPVGAVAVVAGAGITEMYRFLGAQGVVEGGPTMNPSVGDLVEAIERAPAPVVILLADHGNVIPAARRAAEASAKPVFVVPTRSLVEGLVAMREYDPDSTDPHATVALMEQAAATTHTGTLAEADRSSSTPLGRVRAGDWISSVDGEPSLLADAAAAGLVGLLERLAVHRPQGLTLILGEGADPEVVAAADAWVAAHLPGTDLQVVEGGQPVYAYLVSVS